MKRVLGWLSVVGAEVDCCLVLSARLLVGPGTSEHPRLPPPAARPRSAPS